MKIAKWNVHLLLMFLFLELQSGTTNCIHLDNSERTFEELRLNYPTSDTQLLFVTNKSIDSVQVAFPEKFQKLTRIYLNGNTNLTCKTHEVFMSSSILRTLNCNNCGFTEIYEQAFSKLPKLTKLQLKNNRIHHISREAFRHNLLLSHLDLEHNQLTTFNEFGQLRYLRNLNFLCLSFNYEFNFCPDKPILNTKEYFTIECKFCAIKTIYRSTFKEIPKLQRVDLINNKIEKMEENAFLQNNEIIHIDLSNNPITNLNTFFLHEIKSMKSLVCNNCSLNKISFESLQRFPNLIDLELKNNSIDFFDVKALSTNLRIQSVDLEGNKLREFSYTIIDNSKNLIQLCLDQNEFISSYNHTILKRKYVERELRHDCEINVIDDERFEQNTIDIFEKDGIVLDHPKDIHLLEISKDGLVNISSMNIIYIRPNFFNHSKFSLIRTLIMDNNIHFNFRPNFPFLSEINLKEFHCNNCNITDLFQETFSKLSYLSKIYLRNNKLNSIPTFAFDHKNEIEELHLDRNQITHLSSHVIDNLPKLKDLSLNNNKKFNFKQNRIFTYSESLQIFSCNFCGITGIYEDTFFRIPNLRKLNLNHNQIISVHEKAFVGNLKLEQIHLGNNEIDNFTFDSICNLKALKKICLNFNPILNDIVDEDCSFKQKCKNNNIEKSSALQSIPENLNVARMGFSSSNNICKSSILYILLLTFLLLMINLN